MSIRYWFPSDEELKGLAGVAVIDEDGGFVAGTMKCFGGLALAGALAASALTAQLPYAHAFQEDERVVPATLLVDETEYLPRAVPTTVAPVVAFDDDSDYVPAAVITRDDSGGWVVTAPAPAPAVPRVVTDDDQYVGYLGTEDDGWRQVVPAVSRSVPAITDDDQYIGTLTVDDDGQWPVPVLATGRPVLALSDTDVVVPQAQAQALDPDDSWPLPLPRGTPVVFALTDDGDYPSPVVVAPEDGLWIIVADVPRGMQPMLDDDQFIGTAPLVLVDDDGVWPRVLPVASRVVLASADDDGAAFLAPVVGLDDAEWHAVLPVVQPLVRAITDDEQFVPVVNDDTGTWPQLRPVAAAPVAVFATDSEFPTVAAALVGDDWSVFVPRVVPQRVVLFADPNVFLGQSVGAVCGLEPLAVDFTPSLAVVDFTETLALVDFVGNASTVDFAARALGVDFTSP